MFKLTLMATLMVASISAKAQSVTSKCGCSSTTIEIEKWNWERNGTTETLENPDLNTWVVLDFQKGTAKVKGVGTFVMQFVSSANRPQTVVEYDDVRLTINYDNNGSYTSHYVEQK